MRLSSDAGHDDNVKPGTRVEATKDAEPESDGFVSEAETIAGRVGAGDWA